MPNILFITHSVAEEAAECQTDGQGEDSAGRREYEYIFNGGETEIFYAEGKHTVYRAHCQHIFGVDGPAERTYRGEHHLCLVVALHVGEEDWLLQYGQNSAGQRVDAKCVAADVYKETRKEAERDEPVGGETDRQSYDEVYEGEGYAHLKDDNVVAYQHLRQNQQDEEKGEAQN